MAVVAAVMPAAAPQQDELLRVFDGEQAQENLIHQGEDGGISADAEGQRQDGHGDEDGRFLEGPQGEAQIVREIAHTLYTVHI